MQDKKTEGKFSFISNKSAFVQSRNKIRQKFKLVNEHDYLNRLDGVRRFLTHIKTCRPENIEKMAAKLDASELALVFPCIYYCEDARLLDILNKIIELRVSWHLYAHAFRVLQLVYPHPNVFHSFKYLCQLIFNNEAIYDDKPYFIAEDVCIFFEKNPHPQVFFEKLQQETKEISFAALEQKMKAWSLDQNSILGQHLISEYLLTCADTELWQAKKFIPGSISIHNALYATKLLERLVYDKEDKLEDNEKADLEIANKQSNRPNSLDEDKKNELIFYINQFFSCLDPIHPIWSSLDLPLSNAFRNKILEKILLSETAFNSPKSDSPLLQFSLNKKILYKAILKHIEDIKVLQNNILVLKTRNFIIIDNPFNSHCLYYYTINAVMKAHHEGFDIEDLCNPQFKMPQFNAEDEVNFAKHNFCRLPLISNLIPQMTRALLSVTKTKRK